MALILFIDDDIVTLELMSKAADMLGHQALLCSSMKDAVQMALSKRPDLILVDHQLQDGQGCQLIESLRQNPELQAVPIYLVSAYTSDKEQEDARHAGATDCIEKPVRLQDLVQMLAGRGI